MISDEAVQALIDEEGVPVRLQVGDTTPMVAGWLDRDDMAPGSYETRHGDVPAGSRLRSTADTG